MAKGTPTDPAVRVEIIAKVREEGMQVTDASLHRGPPGISGMRDFSGSLFAIVII